MQRHVRIYLDHFGFGEQDFIPCEVHWAQGVHCKANDIHHIENRGMGGSDEMDYIENLQALCRSTHIKYGDKKEYMDFLRSIHSKYLSLRSRSIYQKI